MNSIRVKNREELLSHGNVKLRSLALEVIEAGLQFADPYTKACENIRLEGEILYVYDRTFDLAKHNHIWVVGGGKATYPLAKALETILGDRISGGAVVLKHGQEGILKNIQIFHGIS